MSDELYCFKDACRPCNADCVAFQTHVPEGDDYKGGQQWAHCKVLTDQHREAKHTVLIAQLLDKLHKSLTNEAADRKRAPQPPPLPR